MEIGEGRYSFGWPGDRGYHTHVNHIIKGALNLFQVHSRYLPPGMLDRGNRRDGPDGIGSRHVVGSRHVAYGVEGVWKGLLQGNDVLDHCCGGGRVTSADFTLRDDFGLVVGGWRMWDFTAGRICTCVVRGFLCCVALMVILTGSLKVTDLAVFLKPLWQRVVWCGWAMLMKESWMVINLAVFLNPPGVGEEGTFRVSI